MIKSLMLTQAVIALIFGMVGWSAILEVSEYAYERGAAEAYLTLPIEALQYVTVTDDMDREHDI